MSNERISYKVIANVGILAQYPTGWSKEVNIVSWNEDPAKLDIRDWSKDHEKMSRGITLTADEDTFYAYPEVALSPNFFSWLIKFAGEISLISPAKARDEYLDKARKVLACES